MNISSQDWVRLFELLDTALDMEDGPRSQWLQQLSGDALRLRGPLLEFLAQRTRVETSDLPVPPPNIAAASRDNAPVAHVELTVGAQIDAYRLIRELGSGGMGAVWLAERIDGKLQRTVALKFPYAGPQQRQLAERLARERDILASLEHPNIARLYDAGTTATGQPFLVLEYVEGVAIDEYCNSQRLTVRARLLLFMQVLRAVQFAHSRLVIHRDLKPSNILVTSDGVVRLLDFGIARLLPAPGADSKAVTQFGTRALTPDYASPEQITGQTIGTGADIYALGVVLHELLSGGRPYRLKRASGAALEEAILTADVIAPSRAQENESRGVARSSTNAQLARTLRGDLDTIVLTALKRAPEARYATVESFAQDIHRYLERRPIAAQADSGWYRARKFVIRHGWGAIVACVMLVGIVAVTAIFVLHARETAHQRDHALQLAARNQSIVDFLMAKDVPNEGPPALHPMRLKGAVAESEGRLDAALAAFSDEVQYLDERHMEVAATVMALRARSALQLRNGDSAAALRDAERAVRIATQLQSDAPYSALTGVAQLAAARAVWAQGARDRSHALAVDAERQLTNALSADHPDALAARRLAAETVE